MQNEMLIVFQSISFNNRLTFVVLWKWMSNFNKENLENLSDINNFPIVKPQFQSDSPQNHRVPISSNLNYCLTLFIPWTGTLTIYKIEIFSIWCERLSETKPTKYGFAKEIDFANNSGWYSIIDSLQMKLYTKVLLLNIFVSFRKIIRWLSFSAF